MPNSLPRNAFGDSADLHDLLLKRQIHWLLLWRVIALTFLLGMTLLLHSQERPLFAPPVRYVAYFIAFVYAYTISSAAILKHVDNHRRFLFWQVAGDIVFTSLLVYFSGGSQSIFGVVFFFPIICSGLISHQTSRLILTLACVVAHSGIMLLEFFDYIPLIRGFQWKTHLTTPFMLIYRLSAPGVTFFLVAFLSSLLADRLRRTEEALSETSQSLDRLAVLYQRIFSDINTGIITTDPRGRITSFNPAAEEITGRTRPETLGQELAKLFPGLDVNAEKTWRPVAELVRRDGVSIPVGYSWAPLYLPGDEGRGLVYTFQDLSQIRKMEQQVRQAEKMAGIGRMAAGIAHEFRNPLAAISGAAQMLSRDSSNEREARLMNIILRESARLEKTITEFLLFSRPGEPRMRWFSLARLVDETCDVVEKSGDWQEKIEIAADIPNLLDCWGDPGQIKQILLNLLGNSCQAIGKGKGRIVIKAREDASDPEQAAIRIEISDSGPGINETVLARMFEPFFTTRENGTGLGLAIVWQIVDAHRGTISYQNQENGGVIATVLLPLP